MALTNSDLRLKVNFDLDDNLLTIDDVTPYSDLSYGATLIEGNFRVIGPSGIFYVNAGYVSNDFSSADFSALGSETKQKTGIALPEDSNGDVLQGIYQLEVRVLPESEEEVLTTSKTFTFSIAKPTCSLSMVNECSTSSYTLTDNTDYNIVIDGTVFTPNSSTRNWLVKHPKVANVDETDTIDSSSTRVITPLWTKTYIGTLTTELEYLIGYWTDGDETSGDFLFVTMTIEDNEHMDVECDDCMCEYYSCFKTIKDQYEVAKLSNQRETERLQRILVTLSSAFALLQIAKRCGEPYQVWCDQIKLVLKAENCSCDSIVTTESIQVIPWESLGGGSSTGIINQWYYFAGSPSGGENNDFALTSTGDVYQKQGGVWTLLLNIIGSDGAAGADGSDGANGADGTNGSDGLDGTVVLINSWPVTASPAGTLEATLKTYSLPAGQLATHQDKLTVDAIFEVAANTTVKTLRLYFSGYIVGEYIVWGNSLDETIVHIKTVITRLSVDICKYYTTIIQSGAPGYTYLSIGEANGLDLTAAVNIVATSQTNFNFTGNVILHNLSVEYVKIVD